MCQLHLTAVMKVSLPSLPSNQRYQRRHGVAGHAELSPRDVLGTLASTTELEIHAEPRMDADCYVATAPMAETETTAPSPTAPTAPMAPTAPAKEEEKRVQVGRWEGILYEGILHRNMYSYISYIYIKELGEKGKGKMRSWNNCCSAFLISWGSYFNIRDIPWCCAARCKSLPKVSWQNG